MCPQFIFGWSRSTPGSFIRIWIMLASLVCLTLFITPSFAQDSPNSQDVTGSITGILTDIAGKPLQGIAVKIFQGYSDNLPIATTITDAGGNYQVSFLHTGIYHVGFSDPNKQYLSEYYDHTVVLSQATDIAVAGNIVTGINAKLSLGGGIAGSVVMFDGKAPDRATLEVEKRVNQNWQTVVTYSSMNGEPFNYTIRNLPPDIYALRVQAIYQGVSYTAIYKDAIDLDHATPVTVTAGVTLTNPNFIIGEADNLISGTVTTLNKQPLANIQVTAYISRTYGWQAERITFTDPTGAYQMRALSSNQYILGFRDLAGVYSDSYYPATPILAQATPIAIFAVTRLTNLNSALPLAGSIAGRLTRFDGTSLSHVKLTVYSALDGYRSEIRSQTFSQQYEIKGLQAGIYRLQATTEYPSDYQEYYDGALNLADATNITVTTGSATRNIDFVLGRANTYASIEGKVTTNDNKPLANIKVNAYANSVTSYPTQSTTTNQDGTYQLNRLEPGSYVVCFEDQKQLYLLLCYNQTPTNQATPIVLKDREQFVNANAILSAAGSIAGNVINLSVQPIYGSSITVYTKDNFGWKSFTSAPIYGSPNYAIPGLPAGIYRVRFSASDPGLEQYYKGATDISNATDVTVTSGAAIPNINFLIGTDEQNARLEGRVTSGDTALSGVRIELYYKPINQAFWYPSDPLVYVFTDGTGKFKLDGLDEGDYRLRFSDPTGAFAPMYYGSVAKFEDAPILTLGRATVRTDVNMDLHIIGSKYYTYLPLIGR